MDIYLGVVGCISPILALAIIWLRDFEPVGELPSMVLKWVLVSILWLILLIPITIGLIGSYIG